MFRFKFRLRKETKHSRSYFELSGAGGELIDGESRRNSLRLQESEPKSLAIEVVSSQTRVAVSVDGTTVSRLLCSSWTLQITAHQFLYNVATFKVPLLCS
jgi:hypothetical protein